MVETSVARHAFGNPSAVRPANVTVANLTATMYAIPAQMGAIGDQYPGPGWRVDGCTLALNHGTGARVISGEITNCNATSNGQQGLAAGGPGCTIAGNEIAHNNFAGFSYGWEAGGSGDGGGGAVCRAARVTATRRWLGTCVTSPIQCTA